MRLVAFFISFCFFLLGYTTDFSAYMKNRQVSKIETGAFQVNHSQQITTKQNTFTVADYTDIELEEDYHSNDEKGANNTKSLCSISNLLDNWYLSFSPCLSWISSTTNCNIPVSFSTLPLYLKNRVLRI